MHEAEGFGLGAVEAVLRRHAEQQFAEELAELVRADDRPKPPSWMLSPWAVCTYLLGGTLANGFSISAKYIGNARLIQQEQYLQRLALQPLEAEAHVPGQPLVTVADQVGCWQA